MSITMLAIHKDSTLTARAEIPAGGELNFCDAALEDFKKRTGDPDIMPQRIAVLQIEGTFKVLKAQDMNFWKTPPGSEPVNIVTHTR